MITPQQKLVLIRQYKADPLSTFLQVLDILRGEATKELSAKMAEAIASIPSAVDAAIDPVEIAREILATPGFADMVRGEDGNTPDAWEPTSDDLQAIADRVEKPAPQKIVERVIEKTRVVERPIVTEKIVNKITNQIVEKAVTDKAPAIADKLNTLDQAVDQRVIRDLEPRFERLMNLITSTGKSMKKKGGGRVGGGGDIINYVDLTDQSNGVTKVYTLPRNRKVVGVFGMQFPVNFRPGVDWVVSGTGNTTLTFASDVGPMQTGENLWALYIV